MLVQATNEELRKRLRRNRVSIYTFECCTQLTSLQGKHRLLVTRPPPHMSRKPTIVLMGTSAKTLTLSVLLPALRLLRHRRRPSRSQDATLQSTHTFRRQLRGSQRQQHRTTATDVVPPPQKPRRRAATLLPRQIPLRRARRGQRATSEIVKRPRSQLCSRAAYRTSLNRSRLPPLRTHGRRRSLRPSRSIRRRPSRSRAGGACWSTASRTRDWT